MQVCTWPDALPNLPSSEQQCQGTEANQRKTPGRSHIMLPLHQLSNAKTYVNLLPYIIQACVVLQ